MPSTASSSLPELRRLGRNNLSVVFIFSLALVVTACGGDSAGPKSQSNPPPANGQENPSPEPVTSIPIAAISYHGNVKALLSKHCVTCHQAGGIGTFALDTYESAARFATAIRAATAARRMPPFLPSVSESCQTLREVRHLEDSEIALFGEWVDQGLAAGNPPAVAPPAPTAAPVLSPVDAVVRIAEPYSPVGTAAYPEDDYRCFVLDPGTTTEKFLTAYEVRPGNPAMVHHMIAFSLNTAAIEQTALAKDAADAAPGYSCFGGSQLDFRDAPMIGGWAPGIPITRFPAGTGIRLAAGRKMVLQVHYNLAAGQGTDQTAVALQFANAAVTEANILPLAALDMVLPPGQAEVKVTTDTPPLLTSYEIHGVFPHMHTLATSAKVEKRRAFGAGNECLLDVPRWDFDWQEFFFFQNPVTMNGADTTRLTCAYDTTTRTQAVTWGEGTQDEMCLNFFYVTGLSKLF